jgi:7-keto-8-aminopelargonate synthetase-like enzyme
VEKNLVNTPLRAKASSSSARIVAPPLQQVDRTYVLYRGKKYSYFGGCDYFRLASHPQIRRAVRDGITRFGLNVAASRLTTGNHQLYEELEQQLAAFFRVESAVLISNGYMTNLVVAQALAGRFSHVLIDKRSHGSLQDAARFFGCPVLTFQHRNPSDAARALNRCGRRAIPILLTDGVFSHDGEMAPLHAYLGILPPSGVILLDDAHGAATIGNSGGGTVEYLRTPTKQIIQTLTLSKGFGVYGGTILCGRAVREKIICRSNIFIGNTPLPPALAYAGLKALKILRSDTDLRQRLTANTHYVKRQLRTEGFPVTDTPSPIIPFVAKNAGKAALLRSALLARGIFPSFIRYPGGPAKGYFRFALSSEHSREQLDSLLNVLLRQCVSNGVFL